MSDLPGNSAALPSLERYTQSCEPTIEMQRPGREDPDRQFVGSLSDVLAQQDTAAVGSEGGECGSWCTNSAALSVVHCLSCSVKQFFLKLDVITQLLLEYLCKDYRSYQVLGRMVCRCLVLLGPLELECCTG